MWAGHVYAIWERYSRALKALTDAQKRHDPNSKIELLEAEVRGMEKLLDCFAAPVKIDGFRKSYGLPERPYPYPE